MDPGWKNLVHKYKTHAVFIRQGRQTRCRSVETNSTKSWMKTNIHSATTCRKTYYLNIQQFSDSQTNLQPPFVVLVLTALSMYNPQQWNATSIATAFRQTNFTETKASRINLQWEIKKTGGLTVHFSPDASKAALWATFCAWSLNNFSSSSSPTLLLFAGNLNVWKWVICLLSLNTTVVFCKTRFNSPLFCLFTDLLVLVGYHLIAY